MTDLDARPSGEPAPVTTPHLASIHLLRGLAALAVVIHHSLTALNEPRTTNMVGAAGVPVFFIISGLVIGLSDARLTARVFIMRRLIRVIPMYWLATLAYAVLHVWWLGQTISVARWVRSLLLLPKFTDPTWYPIYFPGWSLSYEMAFYAIFAVMLGLARRRVQAVTLAVLIFLSSLAIPAPFAHGALFGSDRLAEFAAGLALAMAIRGGFRVERRTGLLCIALGIGAFACNPIDGGLQRVLHWGAPAFLLTFGMTGLEGMAWLNSRAARLAGDSSYAVYLFHVTALEIFMYVDQWAGWGLRVGNVWRREAVFVPVAVAAGVGVHLLVERPLQFWLRRVQRI